MVAKYLYKFNYNDPLLKKRRQAAKIKLGIAACAVLLVSIGGVYTVFFTGLFEIRDVALSGLATIDEGIVRVKMEDFMGRKVAGFIPWGKNILFFSSSRLEKDFIRHWPQLASITVSRDWFHGLVIEFKERELAGIWCAGDGPCVYFDKSGSMWGNAPRSSGGLVTVIEDERQTVPAFDKEYFTHIKEASARLVQLGLGAKRARISKDDFHDYEIYTFKDFPVMLSLDVNVDEQMDALKLFLNQKAPKNWEPEYIDLRIAGRFYYK